jgi:photosystem II stability/assembly factor-like uncharacterized protein
VLTPLERLVLSPDTLKLNVTQSGSFAVAAFDSAGVAVAGVRPVWSTNDSAGVIISVGGSGLITAVGEGTAQVYATAGGVVDTAAVAVGPAQSGWYNQVSNAGVDLNGVFFLPDGRTGWAVGNAGRIVSTRNAGATWSVEVSGTAFNLHGVWFTSPLEGWAVGANGTVLRTTDGGTDWDLVNAGAGETLMDVFFATDSAGWAVGSSGVILRTRDRGATWQKLYRGGFTLNSVSFADTSHGWAVGDNGLIVGTHDGGASWFIVQPAVTGQNLEGVWRRSESRAWAAGAQGVTPRTVVGPDSTAWELRNAGAANQLEGVCFASDLVGYVVGYSGTGAVLRTDDGGTSWSPQVSNTQYRLNDVFFVDASSGWAVGANGTIIHTGTGGAP